MKKRFELINEKSSKFWEVEVSGNELTVRYGKIDTEGTSKTKELADNDAALKEETKLIKSKTKKGYISVDGSAEEPQVQPDVSPKKIKKTKKTPKADLSDDESDLLAKLENPDKELLKTLKSRDGFPKPVLEKMLTCGDSEIATLALSFLSGEKPSADTPFQESIAPAQVERIQLPAKARDIRKLFKKYTESINLREFSALLHTLDGLDYASDFSWRIYEATILNLKYAVGANEAALGKSIIQNFAVLKPELDEDSDIYKVAACCLDFALTYKDSAVEKIVFETLLPKKPEKDNDIENGQLCFQLSRYYAQTNEPEKVELFMKMAINNGVSAKQFTINSSFSSYLDNSNISVILSDYVDSRFKNPGSITELYLRGSECEFIYDEDLQQLENLEELRFAPDKPLDLPEAFLSLNVKCIKIGEHLNIDSVVGFKSLNSIYVQNPTSDKLLTILSQFPEIEELQLINDWDEDDSYNEISIPSQIGNLKKLKKLSLRSIVISSLPSEIGNLENLEEFSLDGIQKLTSLPESISRLEKLSSVTFENMELKELPQFFDNNKNILSLNLKDMEFETDFSVFKNLKKLDLYDFKMMEESIKSIGELTKLEDLKISNSIDEMFTENLKTVKNLNISGFYNRIFDYSKILVMENLEFLNIKYLDLFDNKKKRAKNEKVFSQIVSLPKFRELKTDKDKYDLNYFRAIYKRDNAISSASGEIDLKGKNLVIVGNIKVSKGYLTELLMADGAKSVTSTIDNDTDLVLFNEEDVSTSLDKWNGEMLGLGSYVDFTIKNSSFTEADKKFFLTAANDKHVQKLLKEIEKEPETYINELYFLALTSGSPKIKKKAKELISPLTDAKLTYRFNIAKAVKALEYLEELSQTNLDVTYLAKLFDAKLGNSIKYIFEKGSEETILEALKQRDDNGTMNLSDQELDFLPKEIEQLSLTSLDISWNNIKKYPDFKIPEVNSEDNLIPAIEPAGRYISKCSRCRKYVEKELKLEVNVIRFDNFKKYYTELTYHLECASKSKPDDYIEAYKNTKEDLSDKKYSDFLANAEKLVSSKKSNETKKYPFAEVSGDSGKKCAECEEKIKKDELRVVIEWVLSKKTTKQRYLHADCFYNHDKSTKPETVMENSSLEKDVAEKLVSQLNNPRKRAVPSQKQILHSPIHLHDIIISDKKNHEDIKHFFDCNEVNFDIYNQYSSDYTNLSTCLDLVLEDYESLKILIDNGITPESVIDQRKKESLSPLLLIATKKFSYNPEIVELLISAGDDVNNTDNLGVSVYQNASGNELTEFCEQLKKHGASTKAAELSVWQALEHGVDKFNDLVPVVTDEMKEDEKRLIEMLQSEDNKNVELAEAMIEGLENMSSALKHYLFVNQRDDEGETPIFKYVKDKDRLKVLVEHSDLKLRDRYQNTPFLSYLKDTSGSLPMVKSFEKRGADLSALDGMGRNVLHYCDNAKICEYLIEMKVPFDVKDYQGRDALCFTYDSMHKNIKKGAIAKTELLLKNGADLNSTDNNGKITIDKIFWNRYHFNGNGKEIHDILIKYGAEETKQVKDIINY